jgi:hypothetical protein
MLALEDGSSERGGEFTNVGRPCWGRGEIFSSCRLPAVDRRDAPSGRPGVHRKRILSTVAVARQAGRVAGIKTQPRPRSADRISARSRRAAPWVASYAILTQLGYVILRGD